MTPATTAPILLAVVLVVAGCAKIARPAQAGSAFEALSVPWWLGHRWIVLAHPWLEIALGIGIVLGAGWAVRIAALGSVGLTSAYLALVAGTWRRGDDVDCDCFGSLMRGQVSARTVVRNAWLLLLALATIVATWSSPSVLQQITEAGPHGIGYLVAALTIAVTVGLVLDGGAAQPRDSPQPSGAQTSELTEFDDYHRTRTPAVPVILADGEKVTLRELSWQRPQLLLLVSPDCGSCIETMEHVSGWRAALPQLDIRLMVSATPAASPLTSNTEPQTVHDERRWIIETFGLTGTPAAVLLGADGYVAGGPVVGANHISDFVDDIRAELGG